MVYDPKKSNSISDWLNKMMITEDEEKEKEKDNERPEDKTWVSVAEVKVIVEKLVGEINGIKSKLTRLEKKEVKKI